jgi:hypothetical protein
MKILALEIENPGFRQEDIQPLIKDEAKLVWNLKIKKVITEVYFTGDAHTAVLVMECKDVAEAHQYLNALPLVLHGFIRFDVHPLTEYTGFSRLFDAGHIRKILQECWSKGTSPLYEPGKPARGQCCVTALVMNDLFGGEILKTPVNSHWHFYNSFMGTAYDFTRADSSPDSDFQHIPSNWDEAMEETSPSHFECLKTQFQELYLAK